MMQQLTREEIEVRDKVLALKVVQGKRGWFDKMAENTEICGIIYECEIATRSIFQMFKVKPWNRYVDIFAKVIEYMSGWKCTFYVYWAGITI